MPDIRLMRATGTLGTLLLLLVTASAQAQGLAAHSSAPAKALPASAAGAQSKRLDLQPPPLAHVYSSKQLRYIMAPEEQNDFLENGVSVKANKVVVTVPGGAGNQFMAIPWAILHPTQAWRIFTPLESP